MDIGRLPRLGLLALVLAMAPGVASADDEQEPPSASAEPPEHALAAPADASASEAPAPAQAGPAAPWCPPELETLPGDVCYLAGPPAGSRRTLVVFLHGLLDDGGTHQHALYRGLARAAKKHGFAMLAPRGVNGAGPGRRASQVGWPTAEEARKVTEDRIVDAWSAARAAIEAREGAPFDEVFVFGFSNGAYYASSLALRGRLEVDGYAVFAGGSAPKGMDRVAKGTKRRAPVFVGVAAKDATAKDARGLAKLLGKLGWPHESASRPVRHVVADAHLERAIAYLRGRVDARAKQLAPGSAERKLPARRAAPSKKRATR